MGLLKLISNANQFEKTVDFSEMLEAIIPHV